MARAPYTRRYCIVDRSTGRLIAAQLTRLEAVARQRWLIPHGGDPVIVPPLTPRTNLEAS